MIHIDTCICKEQNTDFQMCKLKHRHKIPYTQVCLLFQPEDADHIEAKCIVCKSFPLCIIISTQTHAYIYVTYRYLFVKLNLIVHKVISMGLQNKDQIHYYFVVMNCKTSYLTVLLQHTHTHTHTHIRIKCIDISISLYLIEEKNIFT